MKIKDICRGITDGSHNPPKGIEQSNYYMLSSRNVFDDCITLDEPRYLDKESFENENKRTNIMPGDVLLTIVGTVGRSAVVSANMPSFTLQRSVAVLHPNKGLCHERYLMYALQGKRAYIENRAKGVAQKGIYLGEVSEIDLPVPELKKQQEIIEKLDKVRELLVQRQRELSLLDTLIKARFVEMFGDPITDTKNWGQKPLKEMLESIRYGTSTPPEFTDEGYAFIRATNIKNGQITDNDMKYIPQHEAKRLEKCRLLGGEIIIVRSGVNAGDTCVVTSKYVGQYAGYDMILVLKETLNPIFFNTLVNTTYMEKVIKPMTRRAAQPHLNSEQTQSFPIVCVPREQQDIFEDFVKQVDKSKVAVQKALDETQLLFDSLMQKYFG